MEFVPNQEILNRICTLLKHATSGLEGSRAAMLELETMYTQQDVFSYMAYTMNQLQGEENVQLRLFAGYGLKRCVRAGGPCDIKNPVLQRYTLQSLADPNIDIRKCASSIITTMIDAEGGNSLNCWNVSLLEELTKALRSEDINLVDGALRTIVKICEDHSDLLKSEALRYPASFIFPTLLQLVAGVGDGNVTSLALEGIERVMEVAAVGPDSPTQSIVRENADVVLEKVSSLVMAGVNNVNIQLNLCRVIILLLPYHTDRLLQMLPQILLYMMSLTKSANLELAREACEIWSALVDTQVGGEVLFSMLPDLIPTLLDCMVYSDEEVGMLQSEPDHWSIPDKGEQPHRKHHHEGEGTGNGEEEEDEEDDDDEEVSQWTLRKCAAIALDDLSEMFGDSILVIVLKEVDQRMGGGGGASSSSQWKVQEGAILALGAIAEGCMIGMRDSLPILIPRLIFLADDEGGASTHLLVRTISFWTLSRYSAFILEAGKEKVIMLLKTMTKQMQSDSKMIQEAAVSALLEFVNNANSQDLEPFLSEICQQIRLAYAKFQIKNVRILFDVIISLCQKLKGCAALLPYTRLLIEPLQEKWSSIPDDSTFLPAIFLVLSSLYAAVGSQLGALSQDVMLRCYRVICRNQEQRKQCVCDGYEPPDVTYISYSLELISAVITSNASTVQGFFESSNILMTLLKEFASDPLSAEIRQAALSLIGDAVQYFPSLGSLRRDLPEFIHLCCKNMQDITSTSACSNAAWCIGQIAAFQQFPLGEQNQFSASAFVEYCTDDLSRVLCTARKGKTMLDNCAITLGRLGACSPKDLSKKVELFLKKFFVRIRGIENSAEKASAMIGIFNMISNMYTHPVVLDCIPYIVDAIVSFGKTTDEATYQCFRVVIQGFREDSCGAGHAWAQHMNLIRQSNPALVTHLTDTYG